jgi:hypothetical protein
MDPARSTGAGGGTHPYETQEGIVRIHPIPPTYPELPLLKVTDKEGGFELPANELIKGVPACTNCEFDVWLLAKNETTGEYVGLSPFWDIGGIDVILHFNTTLLEAVSVTLDPDGTFESFYPGGLQNIQDDPLTPFEETARIDNTTGEVQVTFLGIPDFITQYHTPPSGFIRMFSVEFHALYDSDTFPPPKEPLYLEGPQLWTSPRQFNFHSKTLIDLSDPVGTTWDEITPNFLVRPFEIIGWEDNGDGEVSYCDQLMLNHTQTGYYFDYHVEQVAGTLNLTMVSTVDNYIWPVTIPEDGMANAMGPWPGRVVGSAPSAAVYDGFGEPNWTGNFTLNYPLDSVNSIEVVALPFTADEYSYYLVEGVDFIVHADDDLIELVTPVDVPIINEHWKDGVNNSLGGWPWIGHLATGIESVFVDMNNGTARFDAT